jgi:outer membrane lipoprotein-sorting protein
MKKLLPVLILIATVVSGCQSAKVSGSASETTAPTASTAPSDPKAAVIEASRKFIALKSLTGKIEADAATPYKQTVEYAAPDRYHVHYRDNAGAETETIMAGNDSWVKSGNSWNKMEGSTNPTPTMRLPFTEEGLKSLTDVKFEGEESVNGTPTLKYSYKQVTVVGNFPKKQTIWVSKTSGLPMKSYVEYSDGPIKTLSTTFDTESPVTIEVPSKK